MCLEQSDRRPVLFCADHRNLRCRACVRTKGSDPRGGGATGPVVDDERCLKTAKLVVQRAGLFCCFGGRKVSNKKISGGSFHRENLLFLCKAFFPFKVIKKEWTKKETLHYVFEKAGTAPLWVLNQTPKNTMKLFFSFPCLGCFFGALFKGKEDGNLQARQKKLILGLIVGKIALHFFQKMWCK